MGMRKRRYSRDKDVGAHLELERPHLCCASVADDEAVRTERVVTTDILPECFSGTLRIGALFLGE
jgi:hypothetical protein